MCAACPVDDGTGSIFFPSQIYRMAKGLTVLSIIVWWNSGTAGLRGSMILMSHQPHLQAPNLTSQTRLPLLPLCEERRQPFFPPSLAFCAFLFLHLFFHLIISCCVLKNLFIPERSVVFIDSGYVIRTVLLQYFPFPCPCPVLYSTSVLCASVLCNVSPFLSISTIDQ
ncbi:hypothetical protein VTN02DRAFT_5199 [Thermoascus thermophilus]